MHPFVINKFFDEYRCNKVGWVITKDLLYEGSSLQDTFTSEVGTMGPSDTPYTEEEILKNGDRFRMLDDDFNVYYEGKCYIGDDYDDPNGAPEFAPLWDFGTPNAGCVLIQYWKSGKGGGWKDL